MVARSQARCPISHLIPVSTLARLIDPCIAVTRGPEQLIVGLAHHALTERVETVQIMLEWAVRLLATAEVHVMAA